MAQDNNQINYMKFNFLFEINDANGLSNRTKTFVNLYSHDQMMLCEIPIYNGQVLTPKNIDKEIKITEDVNSYYYILVNYTQKTASKLDSLNDPNPIPIKFETIIGEFFSFNEKYIKPSSSIQVKTYKDGPLLIEEYIETIGSSNSSTRLFYTNEPVSTKFSFSTDLESLKKSKIIKVEIVEKKNGMTQHLVWELSKINETIAPAIYKFMTKDIVKKTN